MRIGYFFWGHLGDKLTDETRDTPDGNASYSSCIIHELIFRGHTVYRLGYNRDLKEYRKYGADIFNSFEKTKRHNAYSLFRSVNWDEKNIKLIDEPNLDIILLEWRFHITGRNTANDIGNKNFQPDLLMQGEILKTYYKRERTKLIIFDLDNKLTPLSEASIRKYWGNRAIIFETSLSPQRNIIKRVSVNIPFWMKESNLEEKTGTFVDRKLVYIGSNYERDKMIDEYINPFSKIKENEGTVHFYGNWKKYPDKYKKLFDRGWTEIVYHDRVGLVDFKKIYEHAVACPLLAKDNYAKNGFMTMRIIESLYFGALPIGFNNFFGIAKYLPYNLIAEDYNDLNKKVNRLMKMKISSYNKIRKSLWNRLEFMDVKYFVNAMFYFTNTIGVKLR